METLETATAEVVSAGVQEATDGTVGSWVVGTAAVDGTGRGTEVVVVGPEEVVVEDEEGTEGATEETAVVGVVWVRAAEERRVARHPLWTGPPRRRDAADAPSHFLHGR